MATMNAVQIHKFGGPEVLEYSTNVPRPKPGPDDVLVQIKAVGVNPVDVVIRSGQFPFYPPFPLSWVLILLVLLKKLEAM